MPGKNPLTVLATTLLIASNAIADTTQYRPVTNSAYYVSVPVVNADPIFSTRTVEHPVRQCTTSSRSVSNYSSDHRYEHDYERRPARRNYFVPGLLGGIVGGLIGNQFGGGRGKKALTVLGAFAGSSIARDTARHHDQSRTYRDADRTPARVCHTTYESEVIESINGYNVTYEYNGQQFTKRLSDDPGDSIRVRVQLSPDNDGSYLDD